MLYDAPTENFAAACEASEEGTRTSDAAGVIFAKQPFLRWEMLIDLRRRYGAAVATVAVRRYQRHLEFLVSDYQKHGESPPAEWVRTLAELDGALTDADSNTFKPQD